MSSKKFSGYFETLDACAKARYRQKIAKIAESLDDPYLLFNRPSGTDWPAIQYGDIYNFLKHTFSPYTHDALKAFKSLDGYKYLVAGKVHDIRVFTPCPDRNRFVLTAKVDHSQSTTSHPLRPWVAAEKSGAVICVHCTCTAGLRETCSHIAALLFAADTNTSMESNVSCTSLSCEWLKPKSAPVQYRPNAEIAFTVPSKKTKSILGGETVTETATTKECSGMAPFCQSCWPNGLPEKVSQFQQVLMMPFQVRMRPRKTPHYASARKIKAEK